MVRRLAVVALLLAGCYSRRYFSVPRTESGLWCLDYCIKQHLRCHDGLGPSRGMNCQKDEDSCLAGCPGATQISYAEWMGSDAG